MNDICVMHIDTGKEWRGGQAQVLNLCKGLAEAGIPQLLLAQKGAPLAERAKAAGIGVREVAFHGEFDPAALWTMRRTVGQFSPSLLHAHDAHAHTLALLSTAGVPSVHCVVSRRVDFRIPKGPFSGWKYLNRRANYFAISNGVKDVLVERGVHPDRIAVVPSGVDPGRFRFEVPRQEMKERLGIPSDAIVIGTIGSLVDHKGHRYLVDAMPQILRAEHRARLVIVGDGDLRGPLEKQVRDQGLEGDVTFTGFQKDVELYLSGIDIYALPSHLEGLCTSLIDAMLFRLPIAASCTGGVPDLVIDGETGLLVEPKKPAELAAAILKLTQDQSLARRLGEAAREHALANFTATRMVSKTIENYRRIAGRA